ncbi:Citrate synthase [Colletotrichum orbiculare MAFF 240422]|uniref:Citrate synthase n=1 Tax=Colletotrichum orbiculare (strain 104-T / ATCC 96160 / CBS 514.97 / LARS 414 / MAFF 240422) TaxID=1213857 RepID=N4VX45_COLOR|nr:Citrate synthase [Colletotrichum orbiculare MAFF 240422]
MNWIHRLVQLLHKFFRPSPTPDRSLPSSETLTIRDNRSLRVYEVPIRNNAVYALEFRKMTASPGVIGQFEPGLRILDPGFQNTACAESSITHIDGTLGRITYRNYTIEHLFEHHDFEDVMYLLIWGQLPSLAEKRHFQLSLALKCNPPQHVVETIQSFSPGATTSSMLIAGMAAYASHGEGAIHTLSSARPVYLGRAEKVDGAIIDCIAALACVVSLVYCHKRNKPFTPPVAEESFIANVLRMMGFSKPGREVQHCFEKLWILYADHEMTNSTAAFLHAASTLADPLSCCISALVSGYGPLHGGAIEVAYKTFEVLKTPDNVASLIEEVRAKKQRLFGYGHRIYKTADPRTKLVRSLMDRHRDGIGAHPLLSVAMEIDRVAGSDRYFASRNLKANVDLYGCFLYTAHGFETDIIVAMASLSRIPGVLAHRRESMLERKPLLWRPLQVFTGDAAAGVDGRSKSVDDARGTAGPAL